MSKTTDGGAAASSASGGFRIVDTGYPTLYVSDLDAAVAFYSQVLGPPEYFEEDPIVRGWQLGSTWLTVLPSVSGDPRNAEFAIRTATPAEADRLRAAFIAAGATGPEPIDTRMYEDMRYCPVSDPFGAQIIVYCPLADAGAP